ncbi:growth arrest and DNA damage-inducible protein GADD45 alpha-like protein [Lates japonicus]|uniref:Growth arrest and DNA damage-inducible protein GADD45 alpha n=1 Tax=Lates japonicus TaxID=270547 RepID=A0AAD3MCF0_LATJO|nr:growth arrest and DNA damage-inducible protein GADD45 alpha-like protein [Lates japonicus]
MTFEELSGDYSQERMDSVAKALEEVLTSALPQGCITVGVYEAAKSLNVDPDNVVLCILATDDEDVKDVALQIHFTLIQAFCCENDINILRVNNTRRLAEILGGGGGGKQNGGEPMDLHCVLVTVNPPLQSQGSVGTIITCPPYELHYCYRKRVNPDVTYTHPEIKFKALLTAKKILRE